MARMVGVRFKRACRVYHFDPGQFALESDELVIVETSKGTEMGKVVTAPTDIPDSEVSEPLKPVLRKAIPEDVERLHSFKAREAEALARCKERVRHLELPMKLISAEYSFDGSRLVFAFTAEGRVDFRQLVRDLAGIFRTRIELRQVGVRDEAKQLNGFGRCGRSLCCCSFLDDFASVSIKMAKEQDLPLNPMKISGQCGRLLCCLGFENQTYTELRQGLPRVGETVRIPVGHGRVVNVNILRQSVTVNTEEKGIVEARAEEVNRMDEREGPPADRQHAGHNGKV